MKYTKLEYPNKSIHNVIVTNFGFNHTIQNYFIEYYDLAQSAKMYSILEEKDDTFIRNPYINININELLNNYEVVDTKLLPNFINCYIDEYNTFTQNISIDIYKIDNKFYISDSIALKININDYDELLYINGILCRRLSESTISKIDNLQTNKNIYNVKITDYDYNQQTEENIEIPVTIEYLEFTYYNDITNNKTYIPRNIFEKCRKIYSDFLTMPKIIDDINCYSIPNEILEDFLEENKCFAVEKIINLEKEIEEAQENNYKEIQKIIIYKDMNNNKLYIDKEYIEENDSTTKIIMNKECVEISESDLEKNYNIKFIITPVYIKEEIIEKEEKVYKFNNLKFISEDLITKYNINITNRKKIKVNNIINYAISTEEINIIKEELKKDNIKINFIEKNITPALPKI